MKTNTRKTIRIYLQHLKKYRFKVVVVLLAMIVIAVINITIPWYLKKFFDVLTSNVASDIAVVSLLSLLFVVFLLEMAQWLFWRLNTWIMADLSTRTIADIANNCFQYLHKHSYDYFNSSFVGSLVKRVNRFNTSFANILDRVVWQFVPLIANVSIIIAVMVWKYPILGLVLVIWITVFLLVNALVIRYKLKYDIKLSNAETKESQVLADTVTNHLNVKLFNGYLKESKLFAHVADQVRRIDKFCWNLNNILEAAQGFLTIVLEIGLLYIGVRLWQRQEFTVGDFVLLQSYVMLVFVKIWDCGRLMRHTYQDLANAEEMTIIFNTPHEIIDKKDAKDLIVKSGRIEFKDVSFKYKRTRLVLADFDLNIRPKEKIALVGPSGAGKTTVTRLLLRMYDTSSGQILIDGQDITNVRQESLWHEISLVPQDPVLFHRTLFENIKYGCQTASKEDVYKASRLAHCEEFINLLPDGYQTYVGERGIKLSGGERQRVAIARAILRNSPILVLDEATSSLDSVSESLIREALDNLMKDKTVIVIAHRLSTIMKMDRIIVIDNGRVEEQGTHKTLLMENEGKYANLWKYQVGGFID